MNTSPPTRQCPRCLWSFQCPAEQSAFRIFCRACEYKPQKVKNRFNEVLQINESMRPQ
jgi:hypothetical protein